MKKIKFNLPYITNKEIFYIKDVFKENKFYGVGKYTSKCENLIAKIINNDKILLTDSCTSALEISALIIKKSPLDEVIMPSYTFTSSASAFVKAGFKVRFVDIEPYTAMIDPDKIEQKINKNTRAIVVVHYAGFVAQIKKIKKICTKYQLSLVEDAAQSFNSFTKEQAVGCIGDFGCYSFHETKNIHAGLSGALVVKSKKDYDRAICIRERGTNRNDVLKGISKKYEWVEIGGSYYPTELQAAFLYSQLSELKKNTAKRKKIFNRYSLKLKLLLEKKLIYFNTIEDDYISNFHAFFIITNSEKDKKNLIQFLLENNIHAYIGYVPLHSSKVGIKLGNKKNDLPITEKIAKRIIRLPFHNSMSSKDIDRVAKKIKEYYSSKYEF